MFRVSIERRGSDVCIVLILVAIAILFSLKVCVASDGKGTTRRLELRGAVRDALGRPIAGAEVQLEAGGQAIARSRTDSAGAFLFKTIEPGLTLSSPAKQGFKPTVETIVVSANKRSAPMVLAMEATAPLTLRGDHRAAEQARATIWRRRSVRRRIGSIRRRYTSLPEGQNTNARAGAAAGAGREPGFLRAGAGADSYPRGERRRHPVPRQRHFHAGGGDQLRRDFQPALRA